MKLGRELKRMIHEDYHAGRGSSMGKVMCTRLLETYELQERDVVRRFGDFTPRDPGLLARKRDNAREIDMFDLWEELIGPVHATAGDPYAWADTKKLINVAAHKAMLGLPLSEVEVAANAFQLLTQAKLFTIGEATYALTPAVHEMLCGTFDSPYEKYPHTVPSEAPKPRNVKEGQDYPTAAMTDYWCQTKAWKYGIIIPITRETLISDRLGQVVKMAEEQPAETKYYEDELAAKAWADSSNLGLIENANDPDAGSYWPEATNVPLFRTAVGTTKADYEKAINSCINNLLHWDNLSKVIVMLRSMQNRKGSYINTFSGGVLTVVVPINIEHRARMIANPRSGVEIRANAAAGTPYNILHTPEYIQNMGVSSVRVVPWILLTGAGTPAESVWYGCGDCKKQFMKHRRWATEFRKASQAELGGSDFDADVLMKVRSGGNSGFRHVDDKFIVRNTNA